MVSPSGDWIGQGANYITTNSAEFAVGGSTQRIDVSAFGFLIQLDAPGSAVLTLGKYTNAVRYPFNGSLPGITIYGNGRGCNTVSGSFEILELHADGSGTIDRLWASFSHSCEGSMQALTGEVRFNSALAPAAPTPRTLHVPADYATIQAAINAASLLTVDTVLVAPGVYRESLQFAGRPVVVTSERGALETFLEAPTGTEAINFTAGETLETVFSGFTITNCYGAGYVSGSSPTIQSNVITSCQGGFNVQFAAPLIRGNIIRGCSGDAFYLGGAGRAILDGNVIEDNGGGISMFAAGSPTISNNIIRRNHGNGMDMVNQSDADILQNLILDNDANGISWLVPSGARGPRVVHNTIIGNGRVAGAGIAADGYDAASSIINNIIIGTPALSVGAFNDVNPPIIQFNDFWAPQGSPFQGAISNLTGFSGNISVAPLFLQPELSDYRLQAGSPGIDAGTSTDTLPVDFEGNTRPAEGDGVAPALPDLGAFEYVPGPPRPATLLTAVATLTNIVLEWLPFDGATNYLLLRATTSGGPYLQIGSTGATNFVDSTYIIPNQIYYYVVEGQNAFGTGPNSKETTVKAGNHLPVAVNDFVALDEDGSAVIAPLANDSDADGDVLSLSISVGPTNGSISLSSNLVMYVPDPNFFGSDYFQYAISDGRSGWATGTVAILVRGVNDAPSAANLSFQILQDNSFTNLVSANDVDSAGISFAILTTPTHGLVLLDANTGRFVYRPAHGFIGPDSFQYTANDGQTNSAPAMVSFLVRGLPDTDRDRMPDGCENLWDLNNPNNDPDQDGATSLQEYFANTTPRDPNSVLRITGLVRNAAGNWVVTWASVGGTRYRVCFSEALNGEAANLRPIVRSAAEEIDPSPDGVASSQTFIYTQPSSVSGARFYRILVTQ